MLSVLGGAVWRDLQAAWRRPADWMAAALFFVVVASLFPLAIGSEPELLQRIGPGVLWVGALLASLLGLGRLFASDQADGTLEQWLLSSESLPLIVLGKVLAHFVLSGLPLLLLAPALALAFRLSPSDIATLEITLLIGLPVLSLIGAVGGALTLGTRGAQVLLALLVLPLDMPVLIFGAGAVGSESPTAHFFLLGAMLALALGGTPWATAAALRIALE